MQDSKINLSIMNNAWPAPKIEVGKYYGLIHLMIKMFQQIWQVLFLNWWINIFLKIIDSIDYSIEITLRSAIVACLTWRMSLGNITLVFLGTLLRLLKENATAGNRMSAP